MSLLSSPKTVFTSKSVSLLMNEEKSSRLLQRLNYYVEQGFLLNPRKGIYTKKKYLPEEMACSIYVPSYLSLEYVLQKSGVIFQYDSRLTSVSYLSRSIEVDGNEYVFRKIKGEILANVQGVEQRENVSIATAERAFLDVLYLNAHYYFDNLNVLNRKRVWELLPVYQSERMEERVRQLFSKQ